MWTSKTSVFRLPRRTTSLLFTVQTARCIRRVTSESPVAASQVKRVLSHTSTPPAVSVNHRRPSLQTPIVREIDNNATTVDDDDNNDNTVADANELSDTSASVDAAVSTDRAADKVRAAVASINTIPKPHSNSVTAVARRTLSADSISHRKQVLSRVRTGYSVSGSVRRKIPFNTSNISPAAEPALVHRTKSLSSSPAAGTVGRGLKRRHTNDSPAGYKRMHVEEVTFVSDDDQQMTPTQRTPTARTPIASIQTNRSGGATIAIRSTPQSVNNRQTSVTVGSNSIHINVAADQPLDTETNNIASRPTPHTVPPLDIDEERKLSGERSFNEIIVEDAKKNRSQHMSDEFFQHLKRYLHEPNYVNDPNVSDVVRAKLLRHTKYHRYSFMLREKTDEKGVLTTVSVLVEHPTTKLQRKRGTYTTPEPVEVVPFSQVEPTLRYAHVTLCQHAGQDATWRMVSSLFTNIPRDWCREYCARCRVCALRARKVHKTPLNPIITKHIMNRIVVDTIDLTHCAVNGFRYIFYAVDHFSKFHWAYVTKTKEADNAVHLFQTIFSSCGPSKFVQCDNGKEFRNRTLKAYLARWNSKLIFSRVRHPQTNGAIERANGHLKVQIHKWRQQHAGRDDDWPSAVYQLVHTINCTRHTTTKHIPYEIIYNRRSLSFSLQLSAPSTDLSQNPIGDHDDEISETDSADRDHSKEYHQAKDTNINYNDDQNIDLEDEFQDMDDNDIHDAIGLHDAISTHNNNNTNRVVTNNGENSYIFNSDEVVDDVEMDASSTPADNNHNNNNINNGEENTAAVQQDEHLNDLNVNHFGQLGQRCDALLNVNDLRFVRWGCFGRGLCSTTATYTAYNNRAVTPIQARTLRSQLNVDLTSLGARWYDQCCPVGSLPYRLFLEDLNTHAESMGMEFFYVMSRILQVNIYVIHVMVETEHEFIQHQQSTPNTTETVSVVVELANKDVQRVYDKTIAIYHRHHTSITRLPPPYRTSHVEGGHYEALVQAARNSPSPWPTDHPATDQLEAARRNTTAYANTVYAAAKMKALYDRGRKVKTFNVGDVVVVAVPAKLRKKSNAALNFPAIIVDVQPVANGRDQRYRVMTTNGVVTNTMSAEDLFFFFFKFR